MMRTFVEVGTYSKTLNNGTRIHGFSPNFDHITLSTVIPEGYADKIIAITVNDEITVYVQADELQDAAEFCRRSMN